MTIKVFTVWVVDDYLLIEIALKVLPKRRPRALLLHLVQPVLLGDLNVHLDDPKGILEAVAHDALLHQLHAEHQEEGETFPKVAALKQAFAELDELRLDVLIDATNRLGHVVAVSRLLAIEHAAGVIAPLQLDGVLVAEQLDQAEAQLHLADKVSHSRHTSALAISNLAGEVIESKQVEGAKNLLEAKQRRFQ